MNQCKSSDFSECDFAMAYEISIRVEMGYVEKKY